MTAVTEFRSHWSRYYPSREPVGYELLTASGQHWVRFHSLPGSKRCPDTEAEWRVLLVRQNELAAEVLGEDQECWLVQNHWETMPSVREADFDAGYDPFRVTTDYDLKPAIVTVRNEGTEFECRWEAHVGLTTWSDGCFDPLLRQIADDKAAPTLWYSADNGSVFAPYSGGVDLFLTDKSRVRELKAQHPDWLSTHPLGL